MEMGKRGRWRAAPLVAAVLVLHVSSRAVAGSAAPRVAVFESYEGERPSDATRVLEPLWEEFERLGYLQPVRARSAIEQRVSSPGATSTGDIAHGIELADRGYAHWIEGEFGATVEDLSGAIRAFQQNPVAFAEDAQRRDILMKALVGLALAHGRLGDADATASVMAELVRSFPDRAPDRVSYPPEALHLYRQVKKELSALRPGALQVRVDDDSVAIYVNERFVGVGETLEHDLPPGKYRVYAHKRNEHGRLHVVDVAPGVTTRLDVDWSYDTSLRSSSEFSGFLFPDRDARRRHETENAVRLAREIGATGVVVVGIRDFRGRRSIIGTRLSLDAGRPLRTAAVALEPSLPGAETIRSLARFLAGGEPGPGLLIPSATESPTASVAQRRTERSFRGWKWLALGAGAAAMASGVVLISIDGPILDENDNYTPDRYDTKNAGIALTIAGGALVATGVALWIFAPKHKRALHATAVPMGRQGWALAVGGRF